MAEEDAEIALLHQMQAGQENVSWDDSRDDPIKGVISSNTENSDQEVKEENFLDDQALRALSPSVTGVDDDAYNPSSPPLPAAVLTPALLDSRSSSRASARKPKTIGGFLADDSDEEDLQPPPKTSTIALSTLQPLLQPRSGDGPTRSVSRSPLHISSTPMQQQDSADAQSALAVDSKSPDDASIGENVDHKAAQNASVQTAPSQSSSLPSGHIVPKARLPHDRVGILEDRIAEDPRGDVDAWLSLISEHRKRNKLGDARATYDRFFQVFPAAVSNTPLRNHDQSVQFLI
jgi:cleavage stimulation factor subunit 3